MKKHFISILMLLNILTFAQGTKTKTTPKSAITQDVAADALKYSDNSKEEEITLNGKDVLISGNENKKTQYYYNAWIRRYYRNFNSTIDVDDTGL